MGLLLLLFKKEIQFWKKKKKLSQIQKGNKEDVFIQIVIYKNINHFLKTHISGKCFNRTKDFNQLNSDTNGAP